MQRRDLFHLLCVVLSLSLCMNDDMCQEVGEGTATSGERGPPLKLQGRCCACCLYEVPLVGLLGAKRASLVPGKVGDWVRVSQVHSIDSS